jgi:hypothetical protein
MSDDLRVARANRALNELSEVSAAFDAVEAAFVKAMLDTSPGQPDKVLKLHTAAQTVAAVRQALRHVIDDGMVASQAIAQAGLTRN